MEENEKHNVILKKKKKIHPKWKKIELGCCYTTRKLWRTGPHTLASNLNSCCQAVPICLEFLFVLLKFLNMPNKIYFPRLKQEHKMMLMNQKFSFLFKFWRGLWLRLIIFLSWKCWSRIFWMFCLNASHFSLRRHCIFSICNFIKSIIHSSLTQDHSSHTAMCRDEFPCTPEGQVVPFSS